MYPKVYLDIRVYIGILMQQIKKQTTNLKGLIKMALAVGFLSGLFVALIAASAPTP